MNNRPLSYPYQPKVERRMPNGCITTNGYAAHHPAQFRHWGYAKNYVLCGERIDRRDWENWYVNYFGMPR